MSSRIRSVVESASPNLLQVHPMLAAFDELPNSAYVPINVVCALFGCSTATVWRRVRAGQMAQPQRIGLRTTRWQVGDLRNELARAIGGVQ